MTHWVMDYETNSNCFLGVFQHFKTEETHVFTMGPLRNDIHKILDFFEQNHLENEWHISFNGLAFDAQLTQHIIENSERMKEMKGEDIGKELYKEAQDIIGRMNRREWQKYSEKKLAIKQIDLFKLNHWDNPAKSSSLKWIQCSMNWHNVQDMPIEHTEEINTVEMLKDIASYCRNDVTSTKEIMNLCKQQIALRGTLTEEYGINLYSASEPRISKELFMYFLCKKLNKTKWDLKDLRSFRHEIRVKDILLPYLKFDVLEFKDLLLKFQELVLDPNQTKGGFKYSVNYRGVKTDFGLGGVHGAKRGIYEPEEHMTIMSSDVTSYYPNLAIRNKWAPAHLPTEEFCELYEWFFTERRKIPKSDPRNYVYKIILNSTYGLSNDKHSFLYDPLFTMRITINGQLSLMMLYTMLAENIPGSIPIMQNTDGLEMMIPKKYVNKYLEICSEWEKITNLELEHDEYQKLIVPDVNNYIGIFNYKEIDKNTYLELSKDEFAVVKEENGKYYSAKTKCKGRFEFRNRPLHKNKSFSVVAKALYQFFVKGVKPEEYIKTNKDIFDYCGQTKARGVWKFKHSYVKNNKVHTDNLQKTLRYYVSNSGTKIIKHNTTDGRDINVEAGHWLQTIFNTLEEKEFIDYNIDKKFYIDRINREIKAMQPEIFVNQIKLDLF
jgi:hypothetical protein